MPAVEKFLRDLDEVKLRNPQGGEMPEFDISFDELPLKADVWNAVSRDAAAAARSFLHFVECLIEHVFGVDPDSGKTLKNGGVFGPVEYYYGLVESQVTSKFENCVFVFTAILTH